MRTTLFLVAMLIAAPLTQAADPPTGMLGRYPEDFFFGMTHGRTAYSCRVDYDRKGTLPRSAVDLLDGPLDGTPKISGINLPFIFDKDSRRDPLRWRIAHGYYWAVSVFEVVPTDIRFCLERIPLSDLPRLAQGLRPESRFAVDRAGREMEVFRASESAVASYEAAVIEPMETYISIFRGGPDPVYYDILPTSAESCTLFIHAEGQLHVSHCTLTTAEVEVKFDGEAEWTKRPVVTAAWSEPPEGGPTPRVVKAAWSEPFYAVARGTSLFFVTELGRLFRVRQAEGGRWRTEEVWGNDRPIVGVIVDAASGRAFAFGRLLFFEVQDEITPMPSNLYMNMPPWSEPTKPHERVLWAARYLGRRDLPKGPVPAVGPAESDRGRTPE